MAEINLPEAHKDFLAERDEEYFFPRMPPEKWACLVCDARVVCRVHLPAGTQVNFYLCEHDQDLILAHLRAEETQKEDLK